MDLDKICKALIKAHAKHGNDMKYIDGETLLEAAGIPKPNRKWLPELEEAMRVTVVKKLYEEHGFQLTTSGSYEYAIVDEVYYDKGKEPSIILGQIFVDLNKLVPGTWLYEVYEEHNKKMAKAYEEFLESLPEKQKKKQLKMLEKSETQKRNPYLLNFLNKGIQ